MICLGVSERSKAAFAECDRIWKEECGSKTPCLNPRYMGARKAYHEALRDEGALSERGFREARRADQEAAAHFAASRKRLIRSF